MLCGRSPADHRSWQRPGKLTNLTVPFSDPKCIASRCVKRSAELSQRDPVLPQANCFGGRLTEDRLRLIRRVNEFCSAETIVSNRLWEVLKWMPLGLCKVPLGDQTVLSRLRPVLDLDKPDRWPSVCVHRILQHQRGGVVLDRVLDGASLTRLDGLTELLGLQPELIGRKLVFLAGSASGKPANHALHRLQVTSRQQAESVGTEFRLTEPIHEMPPQPQREERTPGRAGARAGQPRPLPAARRRLGGPVHQPERHNLGHAGRRRGRSCRHRTRQPGRAAVDDPGAAGPLASAVGPAAPRERPASRLPC